MKSLRLFLLCLTGVLCFVLCGSAGCASAFDRSARIVARQAPKLDEASRAAVAADRIAQEKIAEAAFKTKISVAVARQRLAAYRSRRASEVQTFSRTRDALSAAARSLDERLAAISDNDAAIDRELASFQP